MADQRTANERVAEANKKELAAGNELREKVNQAAAERVKWKPTPTQSENDRAKLGEHILNHEPDGSPEDPHGFIGTRQSEAGGSAPYSTRSMSGEHSGGAQHRPSSSSRQQS